MKFVKNFLILICFFILAFSNFASAKSYLTFEEFIQLPEKNQIEVIDKIRGVVAALEQKQRLSNQPIETSQLEKNILNLWNQIIAKAHAGVENISDLMSKIDGNKLCMFAGWPSVMVPGSRGFDVCAHPELLPTYKNVSLEAKKLGEIYTKTRKELMKACPSTQGIVCNPSLFGKLDYCAPGKNILDSTNSSISCWKKAKEENKDQELINEIKNNTSVAKDFYHLLNSTYAMCLCNGVKLTKKNDGTYEKKTLISPNYAPWIMGHRTCAGLLEQAKHLSELALNQCKEVKIDGVSDITSFLTNINSKIDGYLTEELYKGNGGRDTFESFTSTTTLQALEKEKRALRKKNTLTIENDLYCNADLTTPVNPGGDDDDDNVVIPVHPNISVDPKEDDKKTTITIKIDYTNITTKKEDYIIVINPEPDSRVDNNDNTITVIINRKETTAINVNISLVYKPDNKPIQTVGVVVNPIGTKDLPTLTLKTSNETDTHQTVNYEIFYKNENVTQNKEDYEVSIKKKDGSELVNLVVEENNAIFEKAEALYIVTYTLVAKKLENNSSSYDHTINAKGASNNTTDSYKLIVDEKVEEKEVILNSKVTKNEAEFTLEEGMEVIWFDSSDVELSKGLIYTAKRTNEDFTIKVKLLAKDKKVLDETEVKISKLDGDSNSEDASIAIKSHELDGDTYKVISELTIKGEVKTEVPPEYEVIWTITKQNESSTTESDDLLDRLDDAFEEQTISGKLAIDVKQATHNVHVKVELKKDTFSTTDEVVLDGKDDTTDDDEPTRGVGSNANPVQQPLTPPLNIKRPKMLLRGKDGHQGRWGY